MISLLLPAKYTATARILIEPPGSSDPRAATAVSPVYLESLRTYEHFALSDSLFERAVNELEIRDPVDPEPLSTLKKRILDVEIPVTTKILAIEVTLPDPKKAQELAAFIAAETVRLSQETNVESDRSQTESIERMRTEAQQRVQQIEKESLKVAEDTPAGGLAEELEALIEARGLVQRQRLTVRDLHGDSRATLETDNSESARQDARNAEARLELLEKEMVSLDQQITRKRLVLGTRGARREQIDAERQAAWKALEENESRLAQVRSAGGARGERLQVIDSGVVPEKPSSPNVPLNVLLAVILALLGSLLYVTLEFSFQLRRAEARRDSLRVAGRG
jgi:uncharacterized protein involved in exopolysaccharide biosynthesis